MTNKKRLFSYLNRHKRYLIIVIIFSLLFTFAQISQPFLLGRAIDAGFNDNRALFLTYTYIALGLVILGMISGYLFELFVGVLGQSIVKDMRDDVYEKINNISIKEFDARQAGEIVQLEIRDMENVFLGLFAVFKSLIQGIFTIIISIILMILVNWILALGVILLTPLSILVSSFVARFTHKHYKKVASLQAEINAYSLEMISNIDLVQSLNYEEESVKHFKKKNKELENEGSIAQFSASWVNPSTRLVNNTIYVIIGIAGIIMLSYDTSLAIAFAVMSIGRLSSFLSYTNQFSKPFNEISAVISEYESAKFSLRRINNFLNLEKDIDEGKEELKEIKSITFKNMSFRYVENKKLIEDFSLKINKGEHIAIVGPTGAGKTTIINLLMRFYDPVSGDILINDVSSLKYQKKSLRNKIGMVLQDTWIFKGTILDNIKYLRDEYSDEEVYKASEKSHADSFIKLLPEGYQTLISSKEGLSEGQRQMIAISRVMLSNPELVILDEATSNIDTRSEKLINDAFDEMMKDKTSIVIAHRLSTIVHADTIIVMNNGEIVETGNHEELMKKKGFYYSLYSSQFK